jgi:hypothetical protein
VRGQLDKTKWKERHTTSKTKNEIDSQQKIMLEGKEKKEEGEERSSKKVSTAFPVKRMDYCRSQAS